MNNINKIYRFYFFASQVHNTNADILLAFIFGTNYVVIESSNEPCAELG